MMADTMNKIFKEPKVSDEEFLRKEEAIHYWICDQGNDVFEADTLPDTCLGCHAKCIFMNVSCYTPDCGGLGYYNQKLVVQHASEIEKMPK